VFKGSEGSVLYWPNGVFQTLEGSARPLEYFKSHDFLEPEPFFKYSDEGWAHDMGGQEKKNKKEKETEGVGEQLDCCYAWTNTNCESCHTRRHEYEVHNM
jgi:hypothetical protein